MLDISRHFVLDRVAVSQQSIDCSNLAQCKFSRVILELPDDSMFLLQSDEPPSACLMQQVGSNLVLVHQYSL